MAHKTTTPTTPSTSWNAQAAAPAAPDFRPRPLEGAELVAYSTLLSQPSTESNETMVRQQLSAEEPPTQVELDLQNILKALKLRDAAPAGPSRRSNAFNPGGAS